MELTYDEKLYDVGVDGMSPDSVTIRDYLAAKFDDVEHQISIINGTVGRIESNCSARQNTCAMCFKEVIERVDRLERNGDLRKGACEHANSWQHRRDIWWLVVVTAVAPIIATLVTLFITKVL